jgi:translocation and assembly module TamB
LWLLAGATAAALATPVLLWHSQTATAWALGQVPGLQVDGWQGSPGSGPLRAQRLHWESPAGRLDITDLQVQSLEWHWQSGPGTNLALRLPELKIARLQWHSASTPQPASPAPSSLRLPLSLALPQIHVGTLQAEGLPALQDLQAALHLGADAGTKHRLDQLRVRTDRFSVEASGQVGADGQLPLQAKLMLRSLPGSPVWQAQAAAQGPLAQFELSATLKGEAPVEAATREASTPSLQAQAQIRPFAPWPLGDLALRTQALDIAALLAGVPRTQLDGDVLLRTAGLDQAAQAQVTLSNSAAGRWDQGLLPVRKLQATLSGTPSPLSRLSGKALQLELGDARTATGLITGEAEWQAASDTAPHSNTQLSLTLKQVTPAALDQRAPAMTLSGPLNLKLENPADPAAALSWTIDSRLEGTLSAVAHTAHAVSLALKAEGQGSRFTVEQATLSAGNARAQLKGELSRQDSQWRWQAEGSLQDFDPAVWWPGAPDSAWRRGPHQLKAAFSTSGQAPLALLSQPEQLWRTGAAKLALTLEPSVLAGVPLQGQVTVTPSTGAAKGQALSEGLLQLSSGRNTFTAQTGATTGVRLNWPEMASLAPLFKLYPGSAAWAPTEGEAELSLEAQPQGPQAWSWRLASKLKAVRTPSMSLGSAQLVGQGQTGSGQEGQAELTLTADKLQGQPWLIDRLQADLSGSLAQHRLNLNVVSPARPPAWFEQILGAKTGGGSQVSASLQGQWQAAAADKNRTNQGMAGRWSGQVLSLQGRSTDAASQAWLSAEKLGLSLDLDAAGRLQAADVQPGRVALPGTAIRWAQNQWRWTEQGQARGRLEAQVEPFAVAPLLARAQPELGWQGDLILGAELKISREQQFDADIVFERRSGDLSVASDSLGPTPRQQALGLTDLRLGLAAHNGVWHFTQGLAGQQLGEMAGVATVRTQPELAWPPADAPLDGVWQMRVAELGAWGTWVPPGWRLGGELRSAASLGGRFGAPELTGQISGQGLTLRNVLEGVHLRDGDVDIRLQGATAQIERFSFKGGAGSARLSGSASLGASPKAQLKLALEQFQALGRIDRKLVASGEAQIELDRDTAKVTGDVRVDEGLIDVSQASAAQLPDDVTVLAPQTADAPRSAVSSPRRKLGLALKVELGEQLRLKGRGIDTLLRGDLKLVTSAAGVLSVAGAVRAEQGTYAAYGQKLKIERGVLRFVGPIDDPRLDVFAVRPNIDVVVGVAVTGSALNPRIRLASEPDMPETTKLSWLVLGREPDGLGEADTALLQRAAIALLAGEGEAPTDAMLGAIGITDFSVRQTGTGEARETVVALGKQLSQRWWVGYERSINSTTGTWQLIYRAAQRFTLRAQSGEDHALDLIWTWRWNPTPAKK